MASGRIPPNLTIYSAPDAFSELWKLQNAFAVGAPDPPPAGGEETRSPTQTLHQLSAFGLAFRPLWASDCSVGDDSCSLGEKSTPAMHYYDTEMVRLGRVLQLTPATKRIRFDLTSTMELPA